MEKLLKSLIKQNKMHKFVQIHLRQIQKEFRIVFLKTAKHMLSWKYSTLFWTL